jgi:hypothetical protein
VSAPLQPHGLLLDWVFQNLTCDLVLLVDSDSELLNADLLDQMRAKLEQGPKVFGSGYLHPGQWMDYHYGTGLALAKGIGFYHSRPWIPFVMFRVECVRRILASGSSFIDRLVYDDIPGAPRLSRLLSIRFRLGFFRQHPLTRRPAYIYYDTGARLYEDLLRRGFEFGSVSNAAEVPWSVNHLGGVTRSALQDHHDAHLSTDAAVLARRRLKAEYGLDYSYGDREV